MARESSAEFTSNDGFSVVAPTRMIVPAFDVRQKRVLLRLVEAVDLVDEEHRPPPALAARALGGGDDLLDLLDAGRHGAERDEVGAGERREQSRQRRLARARRAPEDQRMQRAVIERLCERPAGAEEVILSDELVERARPHPLGQRRARQRRFRRPAKSGRLISASPAIGAAAGGAPRRG